MPGSAGNAHLDERVHAESAGVSAADPDDGAGTLAQGHSDAKQSRSRMQTFSNAWLMHPALMDARVKLTICMEQMRVNQMWTHELDQIWQNLYDLQVAEPAMSEMLQLNKQRRRSYVNANALHDVQRKLDDEFTLRLLHLNKLAGRILEGVEGEEEEEQEEGKPTTVARVAAAVLAPGATFEAAYPDGGAGILEDEQRDGAQSRSWRQTFSNDWLMHPEMMVARVELTKCMEQMRVNQMWSHDLEQIWLK